MRSFFLFLYQYRAFLVFILLEFFALFLVVQNSNYNRATFFNSSNAAIGSILEVSSNVRDFINLGGTNKQLSEENALLRKQLNVLKDRLNQPDDADTSGRFSFVNARIVNNNIFLLNNTLTINAGKENGVFPGMGVIGGGGIVGKVKRAGKKYSTIVSLLDIDVKVSAEIKGKINLCTVQWDGKSHEYAKVLYVPRHYQLAIGDTVLTSGYNAIYPPGITIGTISKINLPQDATFYDAQVKLINDFTSLSHVEVIVNKDLPKLDSLTITEGNE
ncbi:MAG: rod shape-determining protein MreC [Cyclobacteriaceae bacterium]|nr:rod shape-determining protein MreC [Cyclobacteriaceae bacterium]